MTAVTQPPQHHTWTFFRAGGLDQARMETAGDYRNLAKLDLKLWVALSCPVKGLEFDTRTLQLLDLDKDERVRVPEILSAVSWCCAMLKDPGELHHGHDGLPLASIDDRTEQGQALVASARQLLAYLGKDHATVVTVADTSDSTKLFANTLFNGDGVVPPESATDADTRQLIQDIIAQQGAVADRSGKPGIDKTRADAFFAQCLAYVEWWNGGAELQPLGDATPAAYAAFAAVKPKITDYFSRCRLAAYDQRAAQALNRAEADYLAFAAKDLSIAPAEVVALPLQRVEAGKPLRLAEPINPAWASATAAFLESVVKPLLGAEATVLTDAGWDGLCRRFAPYEAWLSDKKGAEVEKLGIARLRQIVATGKAAVAELIAKDLALAPQVSGFDSVERLVRYYRDLGLLLRNFVNFADFYDPKKPAIFQIGTLYIDQRSCDLCIRVDDPAVHVALGGLGKMYIAYCACSRAGGEKMNIAACVTQGDGDYLMVGRNGVFYDRHGRDWDATVVKIIDNPISLRQAFWSPYKKFVRFLEEQVAKRAAAADEAAGAKLQGVATTAAEAAAAGKAKDKPKFEVGTIAALGVGLGAIGAILSGAIAGFLGLGAWMPLGVLGIMLLISGPSVIIAFIKLRQRTLGPLLEGTGWAVNGRVKINIPLGTALTGAKKLPAGSRRLLHDPFADEDAKRRARIILVVAILVALLGGAACACRGWLKAKWDAQFNPAPATTTTTTTTTSAPPAVGGGSTTTTTATPEAPAAAPAK
jgi:hypothetical protein